MSNMIHKNTFDFHRTISYPLHILLYFINICVLLTCYVYASKLIPLTMQFQSTSTTWYRFHPTPTHSWPTPSTPAEWVFALSTVTVLRTKSLVQYRGSKWYDRWIVFFCYNDSLYRCPLYYRNVPRFIFNDRDIVN